MTRVVLTLGLLVGVLFNTGHAAIVRLDVFGTVDSVNDPDHLLTGIVDVGEPYAASYVFDTSATDLYQWNPRFGEYLGISAELQFPKAHDAGTCYLDVSIDQNDLFFAGSGPSWWFASTLYPTLPLTSDYTPWPFPPVANGRLLASLFKSDVGGPITSVIVTELPEPCSLLAFTLMASCLLRRRPTTENGAGSFLDRQETAATGYRTRESCSGEMPA